MRRQTLLPALRALAALAPSPILGLVYGAGFEDRPELLTLIAKDWPLLGNDAATVARLKAPESFFAELDRLGIPHPATSSERPAKGCRLARQAQGGRRRQSYRAEPAETGCAVDLLSGACRWTRGLGTLRCQWPPRASAWLQRAMDGADAAQPVSLWRRGAPGLSYAKRGPADSLSRHGDRRVLRDRGPRLGRLFAGWQRRVSARNQSSPRRHARHLRRRRKAADAAASGGDPRGAAAGKRTEIR